MQREMNQTEIEHVLSSHSHGHLACCHMKEPYIVPISYILYEHTLLSYTHPGRKIDIMEKNPRVCVQVDEIGEDQWLSVIVYGQYEELKDKERLNAIQLLGQKISHPPNKRLPFLREELIGMHGQSEKDRAIIYRINITSMTGRAFGIPDVDR